MRTRMTAAGYVLASILAVAAYSVYAQDAKEAKIAGSPDNPVAVPAAADKITVDGDPADWAKIKAIPAPFARKEAGSVRLAWRQDGLYGLVEIKDEQVKVDSFEPWTGDCFELFIEKDGARADAMTDNSAQYAIAANPDKGAGKCTVVVPQAGRTDGPDSITAMWKPVEGGYVIEFMIPADVLKPAKLEAGTKIGLNYAIDNAGTAVEQFYSDKDADSGFQTPKSWGLIVLAK